MYSINRLFFLSLGSVCFLIVPFFWLALAFDFSALENFVIALSATEFVGYPIPELLGSGKEDAVVDKVSRIEIFFTLIVVVYSLLFVALSFLECSRKRISYCARGVAIPLLILIFVFWLKFIEDDHIISKEEKTQLFLYTTSCLVISVVLITYSFRSKKRVKKKKTEPTKTEPTDTTPVVAESNKTVSEDSPSGESALPPPDMDAEGAGEAEGALDPVPAESSADGSDESALLPPDVDAESAGEPADAPDPAPAENTDEGSGDSALPPPVENADETGEAVDAPAPLPASQENEEEVPEDSLFEIESSENLGLDQPPPLPPTSNDPQETTPVAPDTESVAASYQFPSETESPSDETQEETPPQVVDEDADDPKPPPL